jgi:hypothetical protein
MSTAVSKSPAPTVPRVLRAAFAEVVERAEADE